MTLRAVLLGFLGAAIVNGFTYFNDHVMRQSLFVSSHMPVSIYGGLILFVLLINPLIFRFIKRYAFSAKELMVIIAITLASAGIPGSSLMRNFTNSINLPYHYNKTKTGRKEENVLEMAPKKMMTGVGDNEGEVVSGFFQGMSVGNKNIPISKVPWSAWKRPMKFWIPLLLSLWIALVGLSLIIHRQWTQHELLPYPIAAFANSLLPKEDKSKNSIFSNKLFWLGAGIVFCIHMNNYLYVWFPRHAVQIPLIFDFTPFVKLSKIFERGGGWFLQIKFYFIAIGIAYFLTTDVSLSLGIGPIIWVFVNGILLTYGISMGAALEGHHWIINVKLQTFLQWGSYLGVFLSIIYIGRLYYSSVFLKAFFLRSKETVEKYAVWGARAFIVFFILFVIQLTFIGLDWQLSFLYAAITVIIYLVMSRILAETGLYFILPYLYTCVLIWGMFGIQSLGPKVIVIMSILTMAVLVDPRETLMPFIVNSLRLLDLQKIKIGKTTIYFIIAIFLGVAIAVPMTLYLQYNYGTDKADGWTHWGPRMPFQNALYAKQRLKAQGLLERTEKISGWERFKSISPNKSCMIAMAIGFILVIVFNSLRLRFPRFPLHPVMFLIWWSWANRMYFSSFLIGWLIKVIVMKYGGIKLFQKVKPFMVGIIAGEVTAAMMPMIVGIIYYLITGEMARSFRIIQ